MKTRKSKIFIQFQSCYFVSFCFVRSQKTIQSRRKHFNNLQKTIQFTSYRKQFRNSQKTIQSRRKHFNNSQKTTQFTLCRKHFRDFQKNFQFSFQFRRKRYF